MSFTIIAIRPQHPVTVITKRPTERMAGFIASLFTEESNGKIQTKVVPTGALICSECGKCNNWDSSTECKRPIGQADEWACQFALDGYARGVQV